jgi:hypothetical protein
VPIAYSALVCGHTPEGDEVWGLHLAFLDAARAGQCDYTPDEGAVAQVEEYALHHEAELALIDILTVAVPPVPPDLRQQAVRAACRVWPFESQQSNREQVDAWVNWDSGSDVPPPYTT